MPPDSERRAARSDGPAPGSRRKLPTIAGYAAVFNRPSELIPAGTTRFREVIRPPAFNRTLVGERRPADVRALVDHRTHLIVGRMKPGTLRLSTDPVGLRFEVDPPDNDVGRDLVESIRRGDLNQCSFGFDVPDGGDRWSLDGDGVPLRELLDVELFEISIVTFPAYPGTSATIGPAPAARSTGPARPPAPHHSVENELLLLDLMDDPPPPARPARRGRGGSG
jgi:HK97 family phage prohead protease